MEYQNHPTQILPPEDQENSYDSYETPMREPWLPSEKCEWIVGLCALGVIVLAFLVSIWDFTGGIDFSSKKAKTEFSRDVEENANNYAEENVYEEVVETEKPSVLSGRYSGSGYVGDYHIQIELDIDGSDVTGYYWYTKNGSGKIRLEGSYNDNELAVYELDAYGNFHGQLRGDVDGLTWRGYLNNYESERQFSLNVELEKEY